MRKLVALVSATILAASMLSAQASASEQTFDDVPSTHTAFAAVEWAYDSGITQGCGNGDNFCPDRAISDWEASTFANRYRSSFSDHDNGEGCYAAMTASSASGSRAAFIKALHDCHTQPASAAVGAASGTTGGGSGTTGNTETAAASGNQQTPTTTQPAEDTADNIQNNPPPASCDSLNDRYDGTPYSLVTIHVAVTTPGGAFPGTYVRTESSVQVCKGPGTGTTTGNAVLDPYFPLWPECVYATGTPHTIYSRCMDVSARYAWHDNSTGY